ncbi:MAG: hypothetical protein ABL889_11840, partial [Terricaulis sp.]
IVTTWFMALLRLKPEAYAAGWGGEPSTASKVDVQREDSVIVGSHCPLSPEEQELAANCDCD